MNDRHSSHDYEGRQEHIRSLETPQIEVFRNVYTDRSYRIDFEVPEFTAVCPKTSLPDFGIIYISYHPNQYCIELRSLKNYFLSYRDVGIFQENLANRIRDDLIQACQPLWMRIHVDYNVRGGIKTRVTVLYKDA